MRTRHVFVLMLALLLALPAFNSAAAQTAPIKMDVNYKAPDWVTFSAELQSNQEIETAVVFFQAQSDAHTSVGMGTVKKLSTGGYDFSYSHKMTDYFIRPFSVVDYRWEWITTDGIQHKSETNQFTYEDNRFDWNTVESEPFKVHWYEGGLSLAVSVLNAALKGFERAQGFLPIPAPKRLDIYVYGDSASLQALLGPQGQEWVAGHADTEIGVIVAALPPGPDQALLIQQRIPHELMHVLLSGYMQRGYKNLPAWMSEGLASLVELYPNSDYKILLDNAVKNETLLPMAALCQPFPSDAATALLAYAQSASFTRYVFNEYGISGMEALATAYANGLDCEHGVQKALGRSLTQMERRWRSDVLAEDVNAKAMGNLLPWALLLGAALGPMLLVSVLRARRHAN